MFRRLSITKIQEYLFYLLVFLLPWQTRWIFRDYHIGGEVFEYGRMGLYGFDIILVVLLFCFFIVKLLEKRSEELDIRYQKSETRNQKLKFVFVFLYFCIFSSVVWADEKLMGVYWVIRLVLGAGLFWIIQRIHFSKLRLAIVVVVSGFIQGLLAGYQFMNQTVWANKWLGMAGQKAGDLGASVVGVGGERWLRAYGSLPHPNILGGLLVLALGVWCYLLIKARDKYQKRFISVTGLFILLGIFFSFSRGAGLIFFILYLGGWWYWVKMRQEIFFKKVWAGLGVISAILVIFFGPLVGARLGVGENERLEVKSTSERISGYGQAWGVIKNNIGGVGLGNYTFAVKDFYQIENINEYVINLNYKYKNFI